MNNNIMKKIYYIICGLFLLSSCKSSQVLLFQNIPENIVETSIPEPIIKNGDILDISISSLNNQSTSIFSPTNPNQFGTLRNLESRKLEGYLVDSSGNIEIPIIGKLKAKGVTCSFLSQSIKMKLEEFIKTPFVRSKIINFRVSILGEVNSPGTYDVLNQSVTLPELISIAGGLKNSADRKKIMIVRNSENKIYREFIDFTSYEFFKSNYYYLQQNDQIFVSPNQSSLYLEYGILKNAGVLSLLTSILILIFK